MGAPAEAGRHQADGDRLAHQKFLRALSGLVIVIVGAVVGGLEVVVLLGVAADRERGVTHLVLVLDVLVVGIEHLERVARLHLALEVDVVGIDADQLLDHRFRHVVAQRRLVEALVEPDALAVVLAACRRSLRRLRIDVADVDRNVFAGVGQSRGRGDRAVADYNDAQRLVMAGTQRRHQHAQPLAFLDAALGGQRAEHGDDLLDLVGRGAELAQDRADGLALLHRDEALAPVAAAVGLRRGLGQQRDVLRDHARGEAEIGDRIALGGVAERDGAGRRVGGRPQRVLVGTAVATSRTRVSTSSSGSKRRIPDLRQQRIEIADRGRDLVGARRRADEVAGDEGYFGVRLRGRRLLVAGDRIGKKLLRIERRDVGGEIGHGERQIAGDADVSAGAHQFAFADAGRGRNFQDLPRHALFADRRQAIGLAESIQAVADAGDRAAQRHLDALRRGGEIGFAVERRKNGAAHECRAAQSGQDRAGEPLHREPAPVEQAA